MNVGTVKRIDSTTMSIRMQQRFYHALYIFASGFLRAARFLEASSTNPT